MNSQKPAIYGIIPLLVFFTLIATSCNNGKTPETEKTVTDTTSVTVPNIISYQIVKEYPHDGTAYTEGLQFVDGYLYESTGRYGKSDIRKTDLEGKILQQQKMEAKYFGEGLTVLGGKIYQLTYREKTGFVYDQKTFKLLQTFSMSTAEGWGMTTDNTYLIYGDGGTDLHFLDPATLKEVKHITVTDQYGAVENVNELEYIKGSIYANQWQTDLILKIDPNTGKVVGHADLSDLRRRAGIPASSNDESAPEVMNGIAYDAKTNRIFITGKNWPKLFEIKLDN
jgi:glutamine cyclotransferase